METSINNFEKEIDRLLERYLGEEQLKSLNLNNKFPEDGSDKVSGMINDFYKNQLQIKKNNYSERIKIDKSITLAEKALQPDKFYEFLLDLGKLCLSAGRLNLASEIFRMAKTHSSKTLQKAEALLGLANVFSRRAEWQKSLRTIEDAGSFYRKLNDNSGRANCENLLGSIYGERGDFSKAKIHFLNSLSLLNPEKDLELAASLNGNLGVLKNIQGNVDDSIKHLTSALAGHNKLGNNRAIAETKLNIGIVYFDSEDFESALIAFDEGIEIAIQNSLIATLCLIYLAKSQVLVAMDNLFYASEFADKALDISNSIDDKLTSADIYRVKGIIERRRKNYSDAETFLLISLRMNTSLKNTLCIADTSFELGMLNADMGNESEKTDWLQKSLDYYSEIDAADKVSLIKELLNTNLN